MCIQDVQLARGASPHQIGISGSLPAGVRLMTANANRYSLAVAGIPDPLAIDDSQAIVAARANGGWYPLFGLASEHPAGKATLADHGLVVCEEIWIFDVGKTAFTSFIWGDSAWNDQPERIV